MITTEKLICAFKSNIEYAEGDKRCLTIKKDCVSIISLWYEESFENRKICFKKWMGIPFNVYYDYKYKDKNAMYIKNVLELVGSPAVLCK